MTDKIRRIITGSHIGPQIMKFFGIEAGTCHDITIKMNHAQVEFIFNLSCEVCRSKELLEILLPQDAEISE
jgi:hypothetical protein